MPRQRSAYELYFNARNLTQMRKLDIQTGLHLTPRRLSDREQKLYPEYHAEEIRLKFARLKAERKAS